MERICGECRYYRRDAMQADRGACRLGQVMGIIKHSMRGCRSFAAPGADDPAPAARASRRGPVTSRVHVAQPAATVSAGDLALGLAELTPEQLKTLLSSVWARGQQPGVPLGRDWDGGTLELRPADTNLQSKLIPIELFLHKLVMVRDNLRVLEQKINSNKGLTDGEKVDLQRLMSQAKGAILRASSDWQGSDVDDEACAAADALLRLLGREVDRALLSERPPAMGERWLGGQAVFVTEDASLEEPMAVFFERLMSVRDRLRAIEAALTSHPTLGADQTGPMVTYLRRCYGSLTTFNVLLRDRADYFSGGR